MADDGRVVAAAACIMCANASRDTGAAAAACTAAGAAAHFVRADCMRRARASIDPAPPSAARVLSCSDGGCCSGASACWNTIGSGGGVTAAAAAPDSGLAALARHVLMCRMRSLVSDPPRSSRHTTHSKRLRVITVLWPWRELFTGQTRLSEPGCVGLSLSMSLFNSLAARLPVIRVGKGSAAACAQLAALLE